MIARTSAIGTGETEMFPSNGRSLQKDQCPDRGTIDGFTPPTRDYPWSKVVEPLLARMTVPPRS
jgi:hypothetical protein